MEKVRQIWSGASFVYGGRYDGLSRDRTHDRHQAERENLKCPGALLLGTTGHQRKPQPTPLNHGVFGGGVRQVNR